MEIQPLYPTPTHLTGSHVCVVPTKQGVYFLPVTVSGKRQLRKSIYLATPILQQLEGKLTQLYTTPTLKLSTDSIRQALFSVLTAAQSDKVLE